jgi:hypothetical protein
MVEIAHAAASKNIKIVAVQHEELKQLFRLVCFNEGMIFNMHGGLLCAGSQSR